MNDQEPGKTQGDQCPSLDELERCAAFETVSESTELHLARCRRCTSSIDQIRRDNALIAELVQANEDCLPAAMLEDQIGGYEVCGEVRRDRHRVIYKAIRTTTGQPAALSVVRNSTFIKEQQRLRFAADAALLADWRHPNIVPVFASGQTDAGHLFVMTELADGVTLDEHMRSRKGKSQDARNIRDGVKLFLAIAEAIAAAHRRGIVHGRLTPDSILIGGNGEPRVQDFCVAGLSPNGERQTATGDVARSDLRANSAHTGLHDTRTDVFALGAILYELLTGRRPHLGGGTMAEIITSVKEQPPPDPVSLNRTIGSDLQTIIQRAMDPEPSRRYQSVDAMIEDIRHERASEPISARRGDRGYLLRKTLSQYRAAAIVLTAAIVCLVAFAAMMTTWHQRAHRAERTASVARDVERDRRLDAEMRSADLERALDFLTYHFSGFNLALLGLSIREELLAEASDALARRGIAGAELEAQLAELDRMLSGISLGRVSIRALETHVLAPALRSIEVQLADDADIQARLLHQLGVMLRNVGQAGNAAVLVEGALEIRQRQLGDAHPDTLDSMHLLGELFDEMGRPADAESLLVAAMDGRRRAFGDAHPKTLDSVTAAGFAMLSLGRDDEAEQLLVEALETRRRVLGEVHSETIASMHNVGSLHQARGRFDLAERYHLEALDILRRDRGDDDPETLASLSTIGALYMSHDRLNQAEHHFRAALEGYRRTMGARHPNTLTAIHNLGRALQAQGELAEAEAQYVEAHRISRQVLGEDHPYTFVTASSLGSVLKERGRLSEAETYYQHAVDGRRRVLGNDHPSTLTAISNMGYLLRRMGRLEEAEALYREALEGSRRVLSNDHPDTLVSLSNLGTLLHATGHLDEAETYLQESLSGRRRVLGDDHRETIATISEMGMLLLAQGRITDAEPYLREALRRRIQTLGDEHADTIIAMCHLGAMYREAGRLDDADRWGIEAVRRARAALPDNHWTVAFALLEHGQTLAAMSRFTEAETSMLEAHEVFDGSLGFSHERTLAAAEQLAELYDAWHLAAPELELDGEATEWRTKVLRNSRKAKVPARD